MKKLNYFFMCGLMLTAFLSFTGCSSDDDNDDNNGVNTPAPFEGYAAKYQLTTGDAPYASIEFTESGNYIITKRSYGARERSPYIYKSSMRSFKTANMLHKAFTRGGDVYSPILYGTYTVDADGTYILAGYGKVKVAQDGSGAAFSLELMPNGGTAYTYKASKQNRDLNSNNSSRLCRTWNINSFQLIVKMDGKTVMDITANTNKELLRKFEEWTKEHDEEYDPSDWDDDDIIEPQQVIFTKTGTYMVKYEGNSLAVSTWRWINSSETELQYSWDDDFESGFESDKASISYNGNQLIITEKLGMEDSDDGPLEINMITYLSESK